MNIFHNDFASSVTSVIVVQTIYMEYGYISNTFYFCPASWLFILLEMVRRR
jgi:hypothetical protein